MVYFVGKKFKKFLTGFSTTNGIPVPGKTPGIIFFRLLEKSVEPRMVYCVGKKNTKNLLLQNSVLPMVFLYPECCLEKNFLRILTNM